MEYVGLLSGHVRMRVGGHSWLVRGALHVIGQKYRRFRRSIYGSSPTCIAHNAQFTVVFVFYLGSNFKSFDPFFMLSIKCYVVMCVC